ncbi:DUF2157 domain-containing protein [Hyphobacterium sp.]|uniref:DUF2157 domain-containing protein n=1 Tax=Hyphobacterium sp. TaxID=2004662 RepID=UPI003747E40C
MAVSRFKKRLAKDLDRWIENGLVPAGNRTAILGDVPDARVGWSASGALAILGAVLLGLAAISFVAANWADMGDILRLTLLFGVLWGCFAGAGWAFARDHSAIGHALALLGAAMFGASIVLVAQIFNMSSWRYTVLGIWAVGALAVALLTPSRPVLILASLLGAAWTWAETYNTFAPDVIWGYLPLWAITMLAASRMRSLVSANFLGIGLFVWLSFLVWDYAQDDRLSALQSLSVFVLAAGGLAMLFAALRDGDRFGFGALTNWGSVAALAGGFALQFQLSEFEDYAERGSSYRGSAQEYWETLTGPGTGDYWLLAGVFAVIFAIGIVIRSLHRSASRILLIPASIAIAIALLLPTLTQLAGPDAVLMLRILTGASVFTLAVALILYGSREGRRFTGGIGIALFVAQALYVYSVTFGGLLDTSLFFLIGGLLLFGLSIAVIRMQKHLQAKPGEMS